MAGLIVVWCSGGRAGIRRLLGTLDPRRVSPTWYAVCVLVPTVVYGFALVGAYRGLPPIVALDWGGFLGSFGVLFLVRMFLGGGLGEELGWRGMMLPELARRHEVLTATLLIGVAHGLWHFPASGIGNALVLTLLTVPWSVIFAWMYFGAGRSVLVCAIAHAAGNAWFPVIGGAFPEVAGPWLVWVIVFSWLAALSAGAWVHRRASSWANTKGR